MASSMKSYILVVIRKMMRWHKVQTCVMCGREHFLAGIKCEVCS